MTTPSASSPSVDAPSLEALRDLPGLAHALLTDTDPEGHDRRVVAEIGTDEGTAAAVLAWGRRAAAVATDRDLALDDVIVTTDTAHHLLRAVGTQATGWVYLRVHRETGNLALARRRLAAVTTPHTPAVTRPPAPAGPVELPAGPSSTSASRVPTRAPSAAPPLAARSTSWPDRVTPPIRPPAATPTSVPTSPATAALAPAALPAPPSPPATSRPPAQAPARPTATPWAARPTAPGPPRDRSSALASTPSSTPSSTPPSGQPAAPSSARPSRPSSALSVPPSSAREVPDIAPELPWPRRPPAASALPAIPAPPVDGTRSGTSGIEAPPDSAGVLGQRWRSDPETLRRVLAGLLRLGRTPQTALAGGPESTTTRSPGATPTRRKP